MIPGILIRQCDLLEPARQVRWWDMAMWAATAFDASGLPQWFINPISTTLGTAPAAGISSFQALPTHLRATPKTRGFHPARFPSMVFLVRFLPRLAQNVPTPRSVGASRVNGTKGEAAAQTRSQGFDEDRCSRTITLNLQCLSLFSRRQWDNDSDFHPC